MNTRIPLSFPSSARDSARTKGPWQINTVLEKATIRKRFGCTVDTSRSSVGQGVFFYTTTKVSVAGDTLYVGGSSFAL